MKIIACLGNPGGKYRLTRHNIGFLLGDYFASEFGVNLSKKGFSAIYGTGKSGNHDIMLLFPQTFMNLSGQAVQGALDYYHEDAGSLIVIHDEIEIPFGDIRRKNGGWTQGPQWTPIHHSVRRLGGFYAASFRGRSSCR